MIEINKQLFWDVDFKKLDVDKYPDFVIGRILGYGNEAAVKWLFNHFKKNQIKQTLLTQRGIPRKKANFWALALDVPKNKVTSLNKQFQSKIWPY